MSKRPKAVIDIGSNSVILEGEGLDGYEMTSLGKNLEKVSTLNSHSVLNTINVLKDFIKKSKEKMNISPSEILVTATQAMRVASDAPQFIQRVKELLDLDIITLTTEGESYYTGIGAIEGLKKCAVKKNHEKTSIIVLDIGGASSEVLNIKDGPDGHELVGFISFPCGAVTATDLMKENRFDSFMKNTIELEKKHLSQFETNNLVCVGGSLTSLINMVAYQNSFDEERLHLTTIPINLYQDKLSEIRASSPEVLRQEYIYLSKRSETILGGGQIGLELALILGCKSLQASVYGLRHGVFQEGKIKNEYKFIF